MNAARVKTSQKDGGDRALSKSNLKTVYLSAVETSRRQRAADSLPRVSPSGARAFSLYSAAIPIEINLNI